MKYKQKEFKKNGCLKFMKYSKNFKFYNWILMVFTKRSGDSKVPDSRCHFFYSRNGCSSVNLVKLPIFGFLVKNFNISKIKESLVWGGHVG